MQDREKGNLGRRASRSVESPLVEQVPVAAGASPSGLEEDGSPGPSDRDLVARIQAGRDVDRSFSELYRRYSRATFAYFLHRLGDPAWAEDLNQELHLRLSRSINDYRGECSWKNFVFAIAWRVLAEARKQRWHRVANLSISIDEGSLLEDLKLECPLEDQAELMLWRRRLRACMRKLDEVARAVIIEHYFNDVNLTRLTETLGLTNPSGARATLISALRKLRQCLTRGKFR